MGAFPLITASGKIVQRSASDKVFHTDEGSGHIKKKCMAKKKKAKFSVTKAVKRNARERVGQPKPEKVIVSEALRERRERRHKKTLTDLLEREE
jgi:hypothetical protein